ncbi:MAG: hypothetical protein EA392_11805 [Cryomorphaceae bacterium]|nr:MAG: hypothetical protein EA392_11805 [Cryomorphaceae bacterium]
MIDDTLLLRQVHPSWVQGNAISIQTFTSQTFKPTPKDNGLLSVYNGDVFTAVEAYEHYTDTIGLTSAGIVAVSKKECDSIDLAVIEDNDPFEGHCSLDYRSFIAVKREVKRIASMLKLFATERGWLYQPKTNSR